MNDLKTYLIAREIGDKVYLRLKEEKFDFAEIANTNALNALYEIQQIIKNDDIDDFFIVDEIVHIFDKYNIDAGGRHDFG